MSCISCGKRAGLEVPVPSTDRRIRKALPDLPSSLDWVTCNRSWVKVCVGTFQSLKQVFWLLAKIQKMLWISFWTSVNTRNRNICLDFWVCANCVKGRWVTGACPACNKGAAADAKHLSGADLLVLTFPDSQRILKSQLYYYVTYFFFMWMGDL